MTKKQNTTVKAQNNEIDERELEFISGGTVPLEQVGTIEKIYDPHPVLKL